MPQQQFHPISKLPLFTYMIDGMLESARENHQQFTSALPTPHVLDDEIVERADRAYRLQLEDVVLHDNQLQRWLQQTVTPKQQQEVERLVAQLPLIEQLAQEILVMLAEIRPRTINRMLEMDDVELGMDWLFRQARGGS